MQILHVVPTYHPALRYGGPIYSVHGLCKALAARGHQVQVVTTSVDGCKDSRVPHDRPVNLEGVQVHYARSHFFRRLYFSTSLHRSLRLLVPNVDIVHLHSVFLFPTLAGGQTARQLSVPYVISPRGMLVEELISRKNGAVKRAWIRLFERNNLRGAARIHLTSEEERAQLCDLGLALAPTTVIPNGLDEPTSLPATAPSEDIQAVIRGRFDILCFGRISWKKGIDRLIRAMVQLPDSKDVVAGHDEENLTPKLQKLAAEQNVLDRVLFLPRLIEGADKEALFQAARVLVLPSLSENFGNVVGEAMIRGLPAVVNERVGAVEVLKTSGGGVVLESDEVAMGRQLRQLLRSDEKLAAMGSAGAQYAKSKLTWRSVAAAFEDEYEAVCGR